MKILIKKLRYSANNSAMITIVIYALSQFSGIAEFLTEEQMTIKPLFDL
ncbi:MAG: hypothetical protein IJ256_04510 [Bacteroidaceae bacterium]|nr:hypothetical protein [Bacteroidaceae bacterium]